MTIFICVDAQNGLLFNHRRQSRDEGVLQDILAFAEGKIWMNTYSSKLFDEDMNRVLIEDDFLECAPRGSYCFVENMPLKPWEDKLETIVLYCWNRVYPADTYLDLELNEGWEVTDTKEFGGTSHEKITRQIFRRRDS